LKNYTRLFLYLLTVLILFLWAGCASKGKVSIPAEPLWFSALTESEEDVRFLIKVSAMGADREIVLESAVEQLYGKMISLTGDGFKGSGDSDKQLLMNEIRKIIEEKDSWLESLLSVIQQEWIDSENRVFYYGAFYLNKSAEDDLLSVLVNGLYGDDDTLLGLLESADRFESEGNYYKSAEELIKAALYVQSLSGLLSDEISQKYIDRALSLLKKIQVETLSVPDGIMSNLRIDDPFQLLCSSDGQGLEGVEFLVYYQGKKRDGSKGDFARRLVSNQTGILEFYHPFIPFTGKAIVRFVPGSRDFQAGVLSLDAEGLNVSGLREWIEARTSSYDLDVASGARSVPMGIVLLHTDITGSALKQEDSASSLADALSQSGFNISILPLDPREIAALSEAEFLRDLRAQYKGKFTRVVFGIVGIQDFETRNDSFRVNTSGYLKIVDVESSEILFTMNVDKSVESRSNTLAVSTSFRELGKAFAEEIIRSLE